ncbi:hypothetical protein [Crocosphaera sp. XPORK-15E]|nr:hypothetical protein [Crocosphaera sp. XPORK-15E]MEA5534074.1 hypothetical protein [Crocosphaera sp. XPORK-15E]
MKLSAVCSAVRSATPTSVDWVIGTQPNEHNRTNRRSPFIRVDEEAR